MPDGAPRFHAGELAAQRTAATLGVAAELSSHISSSLAQFPSATPFLSSLRHVWLTFVLGDGNVCVAPIFGPPGFVDVSPAGTEVVLSPTETAALPHGRLVGGNPVGLLAIDYMARRRLRINGKLTCVSANPLRLTVGVQEAFPNCPKYIMRREERLSVRDQENEALPRRPTVHATDDADTTANGKSPLAASRTALDADDVRMLRAADTLFLGTFHKQAGADTSHRGGRPGFVRVRDERTIVLPDYRGNGMFQSFGNLHSNPAVALAVLDFASGALLQVSGRATVIERTTDDRRELHDIESYAARGVRLDIESVTKFDAPVTHLRWEDVEPSPYNPTIDLPEAEGGASQSSGSPFPMSVTLVKVMGEAEAVKTFRFLAPRPVTFRPGQYATFEFAATSIAGASAPFVRTWTLSEVSNSSAGDVTLEVSVKRKPGGLISCFLHDVASPGLTASLLGVDGDMTPFTPDGRLDERAQHVGGRLLLISGGIGITPNVAILRGVGARRVDVDVTFVYQGRGREMPFAEEVRRRARSSGGAVRVLQAVTGKSDGPVRKNEHLRIGRLTKDMLRDFVPDAAGRLVYLCGPPAFMREMTVMLTDLGVPADYIITENFDF